MDLLGEILSSNDPLPSIEHIAIANYYLLSITGVKIPAPLNVANAEKSITGKAEVLDWLKRYARMSGITPPWSENSAK